MKESLQIFEKQINEMQAQITGENFRACHHIASDYTRYFLLAEDQDAIFICEVFQDIFGELAEMISSYELPQSEIDRIKAVFSDQLGKMLDSVKTDDKSAMYLALREIRATMTHLQFTQWHSGKRRRRLVTGVHD